MSKSSSNDWSRREFVQGSSTVFAASSLPNLGGDRPAVPPATEQPAKSSATKNPLFVTFVAGQTGQWKIDKINAVTGESLSVAERLQVIETPALVASTPGTWTLRGVTSNTRYTTGAEVESLKRKQEGLGRPQARRAALIPIRKTAAWWGLAQDQRRAILEEQSHHIAIGSEYLPAIARRLHHSRELGEPFDFVTWFEYAPQDSDAFEQLVRRLRGTREWTYIDREVDIRLSRS